MKDDPKREFYEKLGAEFAVGFLAGTNVGKYDSIDLYNCLHKEPDAVYDFIEADEEMSAAVNGHYNQEKLVYAAGELIKYIVELVNEDYPHTRTQVCKDFDPTIYADWDDFNLILKKYDDADTTLQIEDDKIYFNKQDISNGMRYTVDFYK